jgi:hypothetical protein
MATTTSKRTLPRKDSPDRVVHDVQASLAEIWPHLSIRHVHITVSIPYYPGHLDRHLCPAANDVEVGHYDKQGRLQRGDAVSIRYSIDVARFNKLFARDELVHMAVNRRTDSPPARLPAE